MQISSVQGASGLNSDIHTSVGTTVNGVVDRFFRRVMQDPSLAPRFEGAPLHRLAAQQHAFLTAALGGSYEHAPMLPPVTAGAGTEAALAAHLGDALRDMGLPTDTVASVTAAAQRSTVAVPAAAPIAVPQGPAELPTVPALPPQPAAAA